VLIGAAGNEVSRQLRKELTRDGATILAAIGLWASIRDDREIRSDGIIPTTQ